MYNGYTIATLSSVVRQGGTVAIATVASAARQDGTMVTATAASAIRQDGTQVIDSGFSGATGSYNDYRHSDTAALVLGTTGGGNVYGQCPWGRGTMVTTALVSWGGGGPQWYVRLYNGYTHIDLIVWQGGTMVIATSAAVVRQVVRWL